MVLDLTLGEHMGLDNYEPDVQNLVPCVVIFEKWNFWNKTFL